MLITKTLAKLSKFYRSVGNHWIILKLLVKLFLSDWLGIIIVFVLPLFVSFVYLFLFQKGIFGEFFYEGSWLYNLQYIQKIKIWYELLIYAVGLIAFVYLAVQIVNIKETIFFKKLITGFTTPIGFLSLMFVLYFIVAVLQIICKMAVLAFYSNFRNIITEQTNWLWMIISLVLFTITNLSLGLLFGSIRIHSKIIAWVTLAVFLGLLFFAGLSFAPSDIEGLFFVDIDNARYLNYSHIDKKTYNWRVLSFISPFQPSLKMIEAASNNNVFDKSFDISEWRLTHPSLLRGDWLWNNEFNQHWKNTWVQFLDWDDWNLQYINSPPIETTAIIGVESGDNYQPIWDEQIKRKLTPPNVLFGNLDEFKAALKTDIGVEKWMGYFEKLRENDEFYPKGKGILRLNQEDFNILKRDLEDFVRGYREGTIDIQERSDQIYSYNSRFYYLVIDSEYVKWIGKRYFDYRFKIFIKRPGVYNNYFLPLAINLGWLAFINGITVFVWKKGRTFLV